MFFNKKTKQVLMFVYGEGGHEAQMNRFAPNLLNKLDNYYAITLSDSKKKPLWADEHFITQEFRNKYAWVNVLKNLGPLNIFLKTFLIIRGLTVVQLLLQDPVLRFLLQLQRNY